MGGNRSISRVSRLDRTIEGVSHHELGNFCRYVSDQSYDSTSVVMVKGFAEKAMKAYMITAPTSNVADSRYLSLHGSYERDTSS